MHLEIEGQRAGEPVVEQSIQAILREVGLLTLATVGSDAAAHVNTCYFAKDTDEWWLYLLTPPQSQHARNLELDPICAVNVFSTAHSVGDPISGLQMKGIASRVGGADAERAYGEYVRKHPKFREFASSYQVVEANFSSRFYKVKLQSGKVIDERLLGAEEYVKFRIG